MCLSVHVSIYLLPIYVYIYTYIPAYLRRYLSIPTQYLSIYHIILTCSTACHLRSEWIPFGENQILSLNDKLGSTERVQGGLFTAVTDEDPSSTNFECSPGLTSVRIVDFDMYKFLAFQAEIHFPEEPDIIQIEHFGE